MNPFLAQKEALLSAVRNQIQQDLNWLADNSSEEPEKLLRRLHQIQGMKMALQTIEKVEL